MTALGDIPACWFVVLPDRPLVPDFIHELRQHACHVVAHPSGRPWLFGSWRDDQMRLASAGDTRLAVAGRCSLSAADLAVRLKCVRTVTDVETAVRGACGSFHVAASLGGRAYVRGSLSGASRVYRTTVDGVTVCADRARTLAWLTDAEMDTAQLAAHLAFPALPYPLAGGAMWHGVHAVPPGQALHLERDGRCRTAVWWQAPSADLPLAEAASALRGALYDAVAARVRPGQVLGADLSGGMDSTSLCFLAAQAGARLVTATVHWTAPGNEDHAYAQHAAAHLPGVERLVFASAELPEHFTRLNDRHDPADEPSGSFLRGRAQDQVLADAMRARGATLRLTGHGGDQVVAPPAQYVHTLLRRHPVVGLRHAAGLRARHRWPLAAATRMLLDGRSYAAWLASTASRVQEAAAPGSVPGWEQRLHLPPWASGQSAELLACLLRSSAQRAEPLAADRARHAWIHQAQHAGGTAGHLAHASVAVGLPAHSPFCDDTVIAACLAARAHEAGNPWSYKPLLAAAMHGLMPAHLLKRTTKDHCGQEWYAGLKRHRRELADWAQDSYLVAAGVADEAALRRALHSPGLLSGGAQELENTLHTEAWLRDVAAHPVPSCLALSASEGVPNEPTTR